MGVRDVFFDLDHTLWDFDRNSEEAFRRIFLKSHTEVSLNSFIEKYSHYNQECWKLFQYDKISREQLRYDRLRLSFDAIGYSISDYDIDLVSEEYIETLTDSNHVFEGTFEILDYLSKKYKLHVITNGPAIVQDRKLKKSNLASYFETVTNSEMTGVKKPNPIIFEYALNLAQANKENSVMIGDSIDADVLGAIHIGLDAIFYNREKLPVEHNVKQVQHLLELKNYL